LGKIRENSEPEAQEPRSDSGNLQLWSKQCWQLNREVRAIKQIEHLFRAKSMFRISSLVLFSVGTEQSGSLFCRYCAVWFSFLLVLCSVVLFSVGTVQSGSLFCRYCAVWFSFLSVLCSLVLFSVGTVQPYKCSVFLVISCVCYQYVISPYKSLQHKTNLYT
jgi:hypothetical protein